MNFPHLIATQVSLLFCLHRHRFLYTSISRSITAYSHRSIEDLINIGVKENGILYLDKNKISLLAIFQGYNSRAILPMLISRITCIFFCQKSILMELLILSKPRILRYHLIATHVPRSLCLHLHLFFIYLIISGDSSFTVSKVMNFQKIEKTPDYCDQMPLLK